MYEIIYSNSAKKFLKKLPKQIQQHIISVLERARIRPETHFERLVGQKTYKIRAGDYRIISDIHQKKLLIYLALIKQNFF